MQIAEDGCRGADERDALRAGIGGVGHHFLVAGRQRFHAAARRIHLHDVGVALFANLDDDAAAITAPYRSGWMRAARRALIAADAAVDVEVVGGSEILRGPVWKID